LGKPAVGTAVGGLPEVIADGETGFIVPVNDPEKLAEKIALLLADPDLRRRMGAAARRHVEQNFSAQAMTQRTVQLYRRLQGEDKS
jgi:glycosyltransferase involved in cell wall biosynthesis